MSRPLYSVMLTKYHASHKKITQLTSKDINIKWHINNYIHLIFKAMKISLKTFKVQSLTAAAWHGCQ